MSNKHLFMKHGFPIPPLRNGIGRYVCQLKRVTFKLCETTSTSKGIREFVESDLIDFAKTNPGIAVYIKPRRFRLPCLAAEYLNGEYKYVGCKDMTRDEVSKWLNWLKTRSGLPDMRYLKLWHTNNPSIQGVWSPFTHRDPSINLETFPRENFSGPGNQPPTATELLIEMFKNQKLEEKENDAQLENATELLIEMFKNQKLEENENDAQLENATEH